jgi:asparagine synthase (glutamine-hydrolysing)
MATSADAGSIVVGAPALGARGAGGVGEITCVVDPGRPVDASDALQLLAGNLPYDPRTWVERDVALAWCGDAEVDISDDLLLLVEGRIDNRDDLVPRAGAAPSCSSSQLIAALWRRFGDQTVDLVVGEVAAVVVERGSRRVWAFRDLCAGRPLHVARIRGAWAVASEWRPLAEAAGVMRSPRSTPYEGVETVLPGHLAGPADGRWRQFSRSAWDVPTLRDLRPGAYAEEFRGLLDEAVRCRAQAADNLGVCLSGGLDSTSVIASAAAVFPDQRRTALSMPMVQPAGDERALQRVMADKTGSELRWVGLGAVGSLSPQGPDAVFDRFGAPPLVINWFLHDAMAAEAQTAGTGVVLTGEDGDGCVGGSPTFLADLLITGRWRRWLKEANGMRARQEASGRELLTMSGYLAAPPLLRRAYLRMVRVTLAPQVLSWSLRRELNLEHRLRTDRHNRGWSPGRAFRLAQMGVGVPEQIGPVFTNIGQPWRPRGVLLTHPWADRRLMSFCMGLPYVHIQAEGLTKVVLREAMSERLPGSLLERRSKANISEVAERAARGPERHHVKRGLALARSQPGWFDPDTVKAIETDFDAGDDFAAALRVAMFASWLRWCGAE